ncbi:GNAT family N-acetyltransferase [Stenotrophomonas sp. HITSZ_GD]|uniref:GNAT family N-acetyltransferase n=1 Tax=Stenotrophomonas sp. HITSZ_GD TaxID=3037248 RepID=UPI00240D6205|nr:GNAT family N-acetyltransferase [Stenotrophomonas sp. HITSZ_GD]MDG2524475.1 GNAT family N-acetyltransferase [Stenotrophomonas sp. HITSZ_GD]
MNAEAGYRVEALTPSLHDYLRLRQLSGLSPKSEAGARIGLAHSCFAVRVAHGAEIVGMGRVIGDGGCFFQIVDIAVAPAHQGQGVGKAIMAALMDWLHAHAPDRAYVSLIADGPAKHLYARFGFAETAPASVGMARLLRRDEAV